MPDPLNEGRSRSSSSVPPGTPQPANLGCAAHSWSVPFQLLRRPGRALAHREPVIKLDVQDRSRTITVLRSVPFLIDLSAEVTIVPRVFVKGAFLQDRAPRPNINDVAVFKDGMVVCGQTFPACLSTPRSQGVEPLVFGKSSIPILVTDFLKKEEEYAILGRNALQHVEMVIRASDILLRPANQSGSDADPLDDRQGRTWCNLGGGSGTGRDPEHSEDLQRRGWEEFCRQLPRLLQEAAGQWVAFHGHERVALASSKQGVYAQLRQDGTALHEVVVRRIEPLPPPIDCRRFRGLRRQRPKPNDLQRVGWETFCRELPRLLQTAAGRWVAFHGEGQVASGDSKPEVYKRLQELACPLEEVLVRRVEPLGPPLDQRRLRGVWVRPSTPPAVQDREALQRLGWETFRRELPRLLETARGKWVGFHGDRQMALADSKQEVYKLLEKTPCPLDEVLVRRIEPLD